MSGKNERIKTPALKKKKGKYIDPNVSKLDIIDQGGNDKPVFISIKHLQSDYECFSDWEKTEMKRFWNFNKKLHQKTWQQVLASASKGAGKTGLAYTEIHRNKYNNPFVKSLSPDISMFELRVDGKMRVHGYRDKSVFHLCLLDREHNICV